MVSKEQLEEFKRIYRAKFGKDISDQDAMDQATKLLSLYELVLKHAAKQEPGPEQQSQ